MYIAMVSKKMSISDLDNLSAELLEYKNIEGLEERENEKKEILCRVFLLAENFTKTIKFL